MAYGFLARRWWAPLIVLCVLPAFAYPGAYEHGEPDYSNGVVAAAIFVPVVMGLVAIGVLLKLAARLRRSRRTRSG